MKTTAPFALTIPALLVLLTATTNVHAHGGMSDPAPRAVTTMGLSIDSTFGHPMVMRASYTKGKGGDCLNFTPDTKLKTIPSGKSKIKMRANDGANHVGLCKVYLVDPKNKSKKLQVGQLQDCMRSLHPGPGSKGSPPIPAEMTINVPSDASKLPCNRNHCVLQFTWEAAHITPHELYNNCADVKISGASGGRSISEDLEPVPATVSGPEPNQTPAPVSVPVTGSGKYVYIGDHPDKAGLTQWCNWNCPSACPADMCKLA